MCQKVKTTVKKIGKTAIIALAAIFIAGAANAQSKQKVAVYVTGESSNAYKKVIGAKMVSAITQEENYAAVERTAEFITELNKEHSYQRSGAVSDNQIAKLGEQFGVRFVVVVDVSELFGSAFIAARMINVQTGLITATADKDKEINGMEDLTKLSEDVAAALFGKNKTKSPKQDGITINGVTWATKNVGAFNPEDNGNLYTWEQAKFACPNGWRLPTMAELESLNSTGSAWTIQNGKAGRKFGDNNNHIFLPAAGWRDNSSLRDVSTLGMYWSGTEVDVSSAYDLYFTSGESTVRLIQGKPYGRCVRCVTENR